MKYAKTGLAALALGGALAALVAGHGLSQASGPVQIKVLSSPRADLVSGGDALIEVRAPANAQVALTVNGTNAATALRRDAATGTWRGLVTGLRGGSNTLTASAGASRANLTVVNHSKDGPILSGPHMKPYECRTVESGLGPATDANCNAPTKIDYFYRAADNTFKPLPNPTGPRPADLKTTTTIDGRTVPYIVRVESGTVNRSIYRIAVLDEPRAGAYTPSAGWNGRLAVTFGGGAGTKYNQGSNQPSAVLSDLFLSRGFAYMTATELVNNLHANHLLQGETLMMLKEHFIERYGVPKWTVGQGGSGGAIQQLMIAQAYPGLLDGLRPSLSFPDSTMQTADCGLLQAYWRRPDATGWNDAKKQAVSGYAGGTCGSWERSFVPTQQAFNKPGCDLKDQSLIYDPKTNPKGARCTINEMRVNAYGRDPRTGYARKPLDNVGLQYGLNALNTGAITAEEFLHLNEFVGGNDIDGNFVPQRSVGDLVAIRAVYGAGFMNSGSGGLSTVPIIHYRGYTDTVGDIHDRHRDLTIRQRLINANGDADNQVIWVGPGSAGDGLTTRGPAPPAGRGGQAAAAQPAAPAAPAAAARPAAAAAARTPTADLAALSLDAMTKWLDAMAADPAPLTHAKVVRHKPAEAVDAYFIGERKIPEKVTWDASSGYNRAYPVHYEPRLVAGAPIANDIMKCQLKPVDLRDYRVTFTPAQQARLRRIFAGGVCDFSKPGVGQGKIRGVYQRY